MKWLLRACILLPLWFSLFRTQTPYLSRKQVTFKPKTYSFFCHFLFLTWRSNDNYLRVRKAKMYFWLKIFKIWPNLYDSCLYMFNPKHKLSRKSVYNCLFYFLIKWVWERFLGLSCYFFRAERSFSIKCYLRFHKANIISWFVKNMISILLIWKIKMKINYLSNLNGQLIFLNYCIIVFLSDRDGFKLNFSLS